MTLPQIHEEAEKKYGFAKGDCRLTKEMKRRAKADFIKKLMVKYGLADEQKVT